MKIEATFRLIDEHGTTILLALFMFLSLVIVSVTVLGAIDWPWEGEEQTQEQPSIPEGGGGTLPPAPRPNCIEMPDGSKICENPEKRDV